MVCIQRSIQAAWAHLAQNPNTYNVSASTSPPGTDVAPAAAPPATYPSHLHYRQAPSLQNPPATVVCSSSICYAAAISYMETLNKDIRLQSSRLDAYQNVIVDQNAHLLTIRQEQETLKSRLQIMLEAVKRREGVVKAWHERSVSKYCIVFQHEVFLMHILLLHPNHSCTNCSRWTLSFATLAHLYAVILSITTRQCSFPTQSEG